MPGAGSTSVSWPQGHTRSSYLWPVQDVKPIYPAEASAAGAEGDVVIEAVIGRDGAVTSARVLQGVPLLNIPALDAVRQWKYTLTRLNGQPVDVMATVTIRFVR